MPKVNEIRFNGSRIVSTAKGHGFKVESWKKQLREYISEQRWRDELIKSDNSSTRFKDNSEQIRLENIELEKLGIKL